MASRLCCKLTTTSVANSRQSIRGGKISILATTAQYRELPGFGGVGQKHSSLRNTSVDARRCRERETIRNIRINNFVSFEVFWMYVEGEYSFVSRREIYSI